MVIKKLTSLLRTSKKEPEKDENLHVFIQQRKDSVTVNCGSNEFAFFLESSVEVNTNYADFAVWLCLPIAMSEGKDLVIHGKGTRQTQDNAEKLSDIWSSWLPNQYSMINVSFTEYRLPFNENVNQRSLMCFSGGIDSTYSFITNDFGGLEPDLLTVQGMDYSVVDSARFNEAIVKTNLLVSNHCRQRLFVKSNAYDIYKKYRIGGQLTHVFLLNAVGFMFSNSYSLMLLAADHSFYQQFEVFPAGSTFATNRYFNSGDFKLVTHGESVTRAEKLISIIKRPEALLSISFCKNRKIRPQNCGVCSKCLRTKYMFLASAGYIPAEAFLNPSIPVFKSLKFSKHSNLNNSYIKDTYKVAFRSGNLDKVPMIVKQFHKIQKG